MSETIPTPRRPMPFVSRVAPYLVLTKARLSALVLMTTAVGYVLGADQAGTFDAVVALATLLGTALAAGAANALNQAFEVERDALMDRTAGRPLPAGAMSRRHAIVFAVLIGLAGLAILALFAGLAAAALALFTIVAYALVYTPLKPRTHANTLVGAVCGAIPPMIGWVAAAGDLGAGAWALAGLLFVWQLPHFFALAWLLRDEYARASFRMLPVLDREGRLTGMVVVLTSLMLVPVALVQTFLGLTGLVCAAGSIVLGVWLSGLAIAMYRLRTSASARRVFAASIIYMFAVMLLMVIDRGPATSGPTIHRVASAAEAAP